MDKRKKNLLIISSCLAISGVLLLSIFSSSPEPTLEQQSQEVPLRAEVSDISLSDMLISVENRKNATNDNSSSELAYNNASSLSVGQVDDPEAVARVQALIRANEKNLSSGLQEIEDERQGNVDQSVVVRNTNSRYIPKDIERKSRGETSREEDAGESESNETDSVESIEPVKPSPFHTLSLKSSANKNAIKAYVHSEQVVMAGSTLKMRLGEPAYTDNGIAVPKNSPVFGIVTNIDGERVNVEITSINVNGNILPFKKDVYSKDALLGIYVPGNPKSEITKDAAGGAIDGLPVSGIPGVDAATQIATTIASSAANAGKQVISKNVKKIKVTIKTNYEIYLRPDEKK